MNNSPENLSPIMRLACVLVRCNPDLLALSPRRIATRSSPRLCCFRWSPVSPGSLGRLSGRSLSLCPPL